ncbi:MAG: M56 family metallopeptidase [Planctomycetaceae bacterium]
MSAPLTLVSSSGLLDLAVKSCALMLLASVAAAVLRRASAAWRHLVWCLCVASLLLLPALSMALPAWRFTWLPQWTAEPTQLAATGQTELAQPNRAVPVNDLPLNDLPLNDEPPTAIIAPIADAAPVTAASNSLPAPEIATPPQRDPLPWLAIGWAAGGLLSLVPLAIGLWQLAVLHRRSLVIGDRRWLTLLDELRRQLGVRRGVKLRMCEAGVAPLTWGALRPVLLVPAEASAWSDERRRLVLLHEIAHVRRADWLTQLMAHVACAMYWFNPLVWLAARRMRIERERACDDLVLACGARASDYAQELLALAAELSHSRLSMLVAVPMARRGALEDRVRGILDNRRSRAALGTAAVCLGLTFATVVVVPLAMLRAAAPESAELKTDDPKQETPVKDDEPAAEKSPEKPPAKATSVRGKVLDDATGEPIDKLIIQGGKFDPADPRKVTWGYSESHSSSRDGLFSTTVRWAEGWTARIVADGYVPQPVLASAPPEGKNDIEVTIRLKRGPTVRGIVLDHEGKPIRGAAVFAIGPTGLNLSAGQAWSSGGGINEMVKPVRTDETGRFELPTGEDGLLAVSHATFDAWPAAIPASGEVTIRLPKPARVDIELAIDGADKESVLFYQLLTEGRTEFAGLRLERNVEMANPGKLSLATLPPGRYQLGRNVTHHLGEIGTGAFLESQFFELKAGETKSIDFVREKGARVIGKATWPADTNLTGVVISVRSEKAEKGPFDKHEWTTTFASEAATADGTFRTERIAPGKYLLVAEGYSPLTPEQRFRTSGLIGPSHRVQVTIDVPADGELKLGDLALKPIGAAPVRVDAPASNPPSAKAPTVKTETLRYTGVVLDKETRKGIPGGTVIVRRSKLTSQENTIIQETRHTTDAEGKYSFEIPPEQVSMPWMYIELDAWHDDYAANKGFGYALSMIRKNEKLGERPFFERIELRAAEAVTGTVASPEGTPLAGINVRGYSQVVRGNDYREFGSFTDAVTDDAGKFRLNLAKGGVGIFWILPTKFAITSRASTALRGDVGEIRLRPGVRVSGRVVDVEGKPVPKIPVNIEYVDGGNEPVTELPVTTSIRRSSISDDEGRFAFDPLPTGNYRLIPEEHRSDPIIRDRQRYEIPGVFLPMTVQIDEGVAGVPLEVRAAPHVVFHAQVFDSKGAKTRGHVFDLFGEMDGKRWFGWARPDAEGTVALRVPKGLRNVRVQLITNEHGAVRFRRGKGEQLENRSDHYIDFETLNHDVESFEIIQYRAPIVLIDAVDEDGKPVKEFRVVAAYPWVKQRYIVDGEHRSDLHFDKQNDGRFRTSQLLPDEDVKFTVTADGFEAASATVRLGEGETKELSVTLKK